MAKKSSWKTSLGGILTALGATIITTQQQGAPLPAWLSWAGMGMTIFGPALMGVAARDNKVSSEEAGAKK